MVIKMNEVSDTDILNNMLEDVKIHSQHAPQLIPLPSATPPEKSTSNNSQDIPSGFEKNPYTGEIVPIPNYGTNPYNGVTSNDGPSPYNNPYRDNLDPVSKIKAMGELLGVTFAHASNIENTHDPNDADRMTRIVQLENMKKVANALDKQLIAAKQGENVNLNINHNAMVKEPIIPQFVQTNNQSNTVSNSNVKKIQSDSNTQQIDDKQLYFNFKDYTNEDVINAIAKLNSKIDDIILILNDIVKTKKKLK